MWSVAERVMVGEALYARWINAGEVLSIQP